MKHIKGLFAFVVAAIMAVALAVPAFAADTTTPHKIMVKNTNDTISIDGKTYSAYKLFDSTQGANDAYAYYLSTSSQFYSADLVGTTEPTEGTLAALLKQYFTFTALQGDTSKVSVAPKGTFEDTQARDFADAIEEFLTGKTADKTGTASGETCTINLDNGDAGLGYYIVTGEAKAAASDTDDGKESVVSAVILTNEDPTPVVAPKAGIPTLDKKITQVEEETSDESQVVSDAVLDSDGKAAVAKVGSTVSYEIDSIVPDLTGYSDYTFIIGDSITAGLDYVKDSFTLKIKGAEVEIDPVFADDDKSFTLTIPYATLNLYDADDAIVLTYDATVNDSALTYDLEKNTAKLEYSRNPYNDKQTDTTPEEETYVIDLNLEVDKVAEEQGGSGLAGAQFKLYRKVGETTEYYKWDTTDNKVSWVTAQDDGDTFITKANGNLEQQVRGLDKGTYYLLETVAPEGYNPLPGAVEVTISVNESNGKVTYTSSNSEISGGEITLGTQTAAQPLATKEIVNNKGSELPSTGGIGTTIFYVVGGILVAGAAVTLVTRRRMSAE